jgi:hypothetical protein
MFDQGRELKQTHHYDDFLPLICFLVSKGVRMSSYPSNVSYLVVDSLSLWLNKREKQRESRETHLFVMTPHHLSVYPSILFGLQVSDNHHDHQVKEMYRKRGEVNSEATFSLVHDAAESEDKSQGVHDSPSPSSWSPSPPQR